MFDKHSEFCQAARMFRTYRKFIAVLLAIWLPLFSGNALAVSVVMQSKGGECQPVVVQPEAQHVHHAASRHQNTHPPQIVVADDHAAVQDEQQSSSCNNCGVCHLACCGYLATVSVKSADIQPLALSFLPLTSSFHSITSTPLVPPPLARA